MKGKTLVITGNEVQKRLYTILYNKGMTVSAADYLSKGTVREDLKEFENLILPFPTKKEKLTFLPEGAALSEYLSPNQCVIGGLFEDEIAKGIKKAKAEYVDYFKNEAYVLKNAYITSQGALRLLLETTDDFLVGKKVLITGFGRIGKSLARMLKSLGMKVFIAARSEIARAEASACGYEVFNFSQVYATLFYYDYIFNTVPERIFEKKHISIIREDTCYFELASLPFGVDADAFTAEGRRFVNGSALPGRYFPSAVAENISDFIFSQRR